MSLSPEIERNIRERLAASEFAKWMGFEVVSFGEGSSELSLELEPHHLNPGGIIHGGVIAAMLDGAIGLALRTKAGLRSSHVTVQLNVQYVGMTGSGRVTAKGTATHLGSRIETGEGIMLDHSGRVLARASATFLVIE
ncbi:MAG: PaaI family thioesterase [Actinomycetota bacterium]